MIQKLRSKALCVIVFFCTVAVLCHNNTVYCAAAPKDTPLPITQVNNFSRTAQPVSFSAAAPAMPLASRPNPNLGRSRTGNRSSYSSSASGEASQAFELLNYLPIIMAICFIVPPVISIIIWVVVIKRLSNKK